MREKLTLEQATKKWVDTFNCINQSLIERIISSEKHEYDFTELTTPVIGDYVGVNNYSLDYNTYELKDIDYDNDVAIIYDEEEGKDVEVDYHAVYIEHDTTLPMWGYMWTFGDSSDEAWAREHLEEVSACGFRIYEDEDDSTLYLGIDGAGYNFYSSHWEPLYKARGLKWHSENIDKAV